MDSKTGWTMKKWMTVALLAAVLGAAAPASAVDVDAYARKDRFDTLKISPAGDFYAATVPLEDRTVLVVLQRSDNKLVGRFAMGKNTHVDDFEWVNDDRLLISVAEKFGSLDTPLPTGELYAINANGSNPQMLVGFRLMAGNTGTNIKGKKEEAVTASLVSDLPNDDKNVLVAITPYGSADLFARVDRMDVYTGRRWPVAKSPVQNASFVADHAGVVRFVHGSGLDNVSRLYYRSGEGAEWELVNSQLDSGLVQLPIGFSADNGTAYLLSRPADGPDVVVAFDTASRKSRAVLRDEVADPHRMLYSDGAGRTLAYGFSPEGRSGAPMGVMYMDGKPRLAFLDETSPQARLYKSLQAAFGGEAAVVTSQTADGRLALVQTWSDRNPGDFFLFDTVAKKADHVISRRDWFDAAEMASARPIKLKARDGLALNGYLTVPAGSSGKSLPMVVLPHGGPFRIREYWAFDPEAQMLAAAGYAVLQLNFRGSGGYGRGFEMAGARQWGAAMQDDLTDATRWAIEQGIADPGRICLYGGSYGAYASLMGVAREPSLYRCAAGYVGVYDLPMMQDEDARASRRGANWSQDWVGRRENLAAVSPTRMAASIKAPVFLAAGGEDTVAPIEHSRRMEKALRAAGVPVETLYVDTEGHGFYKPENRKAFYTQLLAFLSRHLGGAVATTAPAPATTTATAR